jgi:2-succinyl-5-enolpyruvyl-6-hydroxy-3-cyclohexene-1-carboxylate synthase
VIGLPANLNLLWTSLLFEEWRRQGLRHVVVCPGSRSAPLAVAAASCSALRITVVYDERSAGFIALGIARSSGRPAAVVTTSGTAVANLLPATVEASMRGTPMLLVTADRPLELRRCGANQAIEQPGIFGSAVRRTIEWPCPDPAIDLAYVLATAAEAWAAAACGPVHLNCPFREPLAPREVPYVVDTASIRRWLHADEPWRIERPAPPSCDPTLAERAAAMLRDAERPLVVCGESSETDVPRAAIAIAEALGAPLLLDAGSSARGSGSPCEVALPDLVLAGAAAERPIAESLEPDAVLRVGGSVTSKRVQELLAKAERTVTTRLSGTAMDERRSAAMIIDDAAIPDLAARLATRGAADLTPFAERWRRLGSAVAEAVAVGFARSGGGAAALTEPWLVDALLRRTGLGTTLVVGNSMPVRDVDLFHRGGAVRIAVNRGASGIDGLVSTAVGHACGSGRPVTLLLGDLSLLHDLGGLANLRSAPAPVHVVVVNNHGGGIFHFLPIAEHATVFEPLFGTPHDFDFAGAAATFRLGYRRVETGAAAAAAFDALPGAASPSIVECMTDRSANVAAHRAIHALALEAVRGAL